MKRPFCRRYPLLLTAASVLLHSASTWADGAAGAQSGADDSGFTVLSNATNVTHWGLGVGAGIAASPYKSGDTKYTPIPLISFDDKWVHAFGTTIDLKIGTWDNVSVALRGDYALADGYKNDDAPILNGMQNRDPTFWYGPALAWKSGFGTLSADYLLGGNRGERAKIDYSKSFDFGKFSPNRMAASNGSAAITSTTITACRRRKRGQGAPSTLAAPPTTCRSARGSTTASRVSRKWCWTSA